MACRANPSARTVDKRADEIIELNGIPCANECINLCIQCVSGGGRPEREVNWRSCSVRWRNSNKSSNQMI